MNKFYSEFPTPYIVKKSAEKAGDRCLKIVSRSSSRSVTGWVIEAEFSTLRIAEQFGKVWFHRISRGIPFICIRKTKAGFAASVPVEAPELACGIGKRFEFDPMSVPEYKAASLAEKEANNKRYNELKEAKTEARAVPKKITSVAVIAGVPLWLAMDCC